MTKRLITIFTLLISSTQLSFSQDTLYFDINWDPSSQKNHAFYRPLPLKKLGELVLIKDYYKNGNLQMQGYVLEKDQEAYVGDIYYYYENGFDQSFRQYENKSSINELTYYHNDGSIWQKITYNKEGEKENIKTFINGKQIAEAKIDPLTKLSGVFSYAQPISHYDQNRKQDPEKELTPPVYIEKYPVIAPPDTGETTPSPIVNKKPPYYITTFWQNGKVASQQKVVYSDYYGTDVVDEKYFDQNGQLLSTVSKDKNVAYKKFEYYTKNYIAQKVKESFSYIDNTLNGKSISYDPDGTIINSTTYHEGQISQKEIYKNGKIIKTNLYKNDEPYSGNFEIQFGDDYGIKQIFTLNNGTKTGEETTISLADTSEIAKGTYQNGKPWEGTFLMHEQTDNVQLLSYKNGKLNGVQKNLTSVYTLLTKEEYETVDNIRQGYRKIYDDEKLIAESIYKNNKVFSGSIIDDETIITYVNGKKITNPSEQINT